MGILDRSKKSSGGKDGNKNPSSTSRNEGPASADGATADKSPAPTKKQQGTAGTAANVEYNPRWDGYTAIALLSLVEFSAVSNVAQSLSYSGSAGVALAWGILSFVGCALVVALDRSRCLVDRFDYTKALDGRFEGSALLFLTVWWIVGCGVITQVDGIGYLTLNIYFSTWLTLAACVYTLNEWSASKDILSIDELTGLSATLKSWYALLLSSLVVFGTSINHLAFDFQHSGSGAVLGTVVGFVSAVVSVLWISVHYRFIECVRHGGWAELSCALLMAILWIVATTVITQDGGVGASIVGTGCPGTLYQSYYNAEDSSGIDNCTVRVELEGDTSVLNATCSEVLQLEIPGSNLFVFTWIALASNINVCFRWKAQQALQFANAANEQARRTAGDGEEGLDDGDDEDDLDDFEDAASTN